MTEMSEAQELDMDEVMGQHRIEVAQDIVIDLKDFLKDAPAHERAGMLAAIEIIKANYC